MMYYYCCFDIIDRSV